MLWKRNASIVSSLFGWNATERKHHWTVAVDLLLLINWLNHKQNQQTVSVALLLRTNTLFLATYLPALSILATDILTPPPITRSRFSSLQMSAKKSDTMEPIAVTSPAASAAATTPVRCVNPASEVNARLDTQIEVRVYPCNNSQSSGKKKFTTFNVKPEVRSKFQFRSSFFSSRDSIASC